MWKWLKDNVEQAVLGIALLPVIFKFGTTDNPIYYTFETVEDLSNFYIRQ